MPATIMIGEKSICQPPLEGSIQAFLVTDPSSCYYNTREDHVWVGGEKLWTKVIGNKMEEISDHAKLC